MSGQSIAKRPRPVVFSLGELRRYPTLEKRYAITLPFEDPPYCCFCRSWVEPRPCCKRWLEYCKVKAKCIKRTGERWAWFSAARDLDDERGHRLGTLGYLPSEIRQQIMEVLLVDHQEYSPEQLVGQGWRGVHPFMSKGYDSSGSYGIRHASPSTKAEFEYYYFTKSNFIFSRPADLEAFLGKLSMDQQSLLRSVTLKLYSPYENCYGAVSDWEPVCARLPPNIVSIYFDVCSLVDCAMEAGGKWFIRGYRQQTIPPVIDVLDLLGKQIRRRAARAKIGLERRYFSSNCDDTSGEEWVRVLQDVEPWSEDWLKWWEESTQVESDDGEGAIEMA